jgi:hypothetical protein
MATGDANRSGDEAPPGPRTTQQEGHKSPAEAPPAVPTASDLTISKGDLQKLMDVVEATVLLYNKLEMFPPNLEYSLELRNVQNALDRLEVPRDG